MKKRKLHIFGCSFSTPFMVRESHSWMQLLARHLDAELVTYAEVALDHRECFHRLQNATLKFFHNDYVVYQFTSGMRQGYMINGDHYYSNAGMGDTLQETLDVFEKYGGGRDKYPMTDNDLLTLIDYSLFWAHQDYYYKYHDVSNWMKLLARRVNYAFLHLDNSFKPWVDNKSCLFDGDPSIIDWNKNNEGGLSHVGTGVETHDMHPNEKAHKRIFNELRNKFK